MTTKSALVIGGGIAGIQASLDLADRNIHVYLVDRLRGQGADVSFESVERRCRELGVEPKRLTGSREEYAQFRRAQVMEGRGDAHE